MDKSVRIICVGLFLIIIYIILDNIKLMLESNGGKKFFKSPRIDIKMPKITAKSLVKLSAFFVMINHGPDLCKIETKIENIPYYEGKDYFLILGEKNEKD